MTTPPPGPEQQPGPQYPSPDQTWSGAPPQQQWQPAPQQGPSPQGQWPPPQGPRRRPLVWVLSGVVGLLVVAVVVVFALDLTRPGDDPTDGTTTQPPPTDDPTTDDPTGELIPLLTNATFDPATVALHLDPPAGFEVADDDADYPRWDHHPSCYIGLSRYELAGDTVDNDAQATSWNAVELVEFYEAERSDVTVIDAEGSANVAIEGGGQLELHVVELEFRRDENGPMFWGGFAFRHMPDTGMGISVNYSCQVGEEPVDFDDVLAALTVENS
ncbi:hypothetical protein [Pseudactinotalea sp.]|uniref:hypothetical protein n=1 Tax=Pseudactinotalea sp. TaxID=1926260 RepID=UPI003B3B8DB6